MAYEQKDNSGSIFVNDRKEKDNHPDRTGTALIDGTEYWVSGWLKKTKDGKPFLSLAFKAKDTDTKPKDGGLSGSRKTEPKDDPYGDGIPF
jgi:hypothetical protein